MTHQKKGFSKQLTLGDAAVNGLCSGMIAGFVMFFYLVIFGQWQGIGVGTMFGRFDLADGKSIVIGLVVHLALTAVYGIIFGTLCQMLGQWVTLQINWAIALGALYGLGLFLVAQLTFISTPDVAFSLVEIPAFQFLIAHGLYGLVLGWLINKPRDI